MLTTLKAKICIVLIVCALSATALSGIAAADDIWNFRAQEVSSNEIKITVDYRYDSAHGTNVFIGAYALSGGRGPFIGFGYRPARIYRGTGTATATLHSHHPPATDQPDRQTDQIKVVMYSGDLFFFNKTFNYSKVWRKPVADDIWNFRAQEVSFYEIKITVDYRYDSAHGTNVFIGAYALSGGRGPLIGFGYQPARIYRGTGTATATLYSYHLPTDRQIDQIKVVMYSGDLGFFNKTFNYSKVWRAHWDWTVGGSYKLYWEGGGETESYVSLPWFQSESPTFEVLYNSGNPDVRKEDGWVLLAKDFGSLNGPNPVLPYFVLYNKYTGIIRVFFYNGNRPDLQQDANYVMGVMIIRSNGKIPSFTFHTGTTLEDFDPDYEQMFITNDLIQDAWTYLEFDVKGYDPNLQDPKYRNSTFTFKLYRLEESQVNLKGNLRLSGFMNAADMRTGYNGAGSLDTIKKTVGQTVEESINAVGVFKNLSSGLEKMDKYAATHTDEWWSSPLQDIASAGTHLFMPGFGAAAGFITSLFFGDENNTNFPLSWRIDVTGDLEIEGTITTTSPLTLLSLYVPGADRDQAYAVNPIYDRPLGLITLRKNPVIEWRIERDWYDERHNLGFSLGEPLEIDFNEDSGLDILSVRIALVGLDFEPTDFYDESTLLDYNSNRRTEGTTGIYLEDWLNSYPYKIGIMITFTPREPTSNLSEELVMYREFNAKVFYVLQEESGRVIHRFQLPLYP